MAGRSPGDWQAVHFGDPDSAIFANEGNVCIATVKARGYSASQDKYIALPVRDNAELMAAAPTLKAENEQLRQQNAVLLEACEAALSLCKYGGSLSTCERVERELEAAIALARKEEA